MGKSLHKELKREGMGEKRGGENRQGEQNLKNRFPTIHLMPGSRADVEVARAGSKMRRRRGDWWRGRGRRRRRRKSKRRRTE